MAAFLSDDFDALGTGTLLSTDTASWSKFGGGTGDFQGNASSRIIPRTATSSAAVSLEQIDASPPSADYEVRADFFGSGDVTQSAGVGILGRVDSGANTYYYARILASSGNWQLFKTITGTATQLGSNVASGISTGATIRGVLRMVGTTIELIADGVTKISVTDSAISAAGRPGVRHSGGFGGGNGIHLDNFEAEAVGGGGGGKPWYLYQRMRRSG